MDRVKYTFDKPITEGWKISRLYNGEDYTAKDEGFVRAVHYSFTTLAGNFDNVVETSFDSYFAPGYGLIAEISAQLVSY
ncbi:hypothetical protein ACMGD3_06845 [Lysinibacillus sphaericus]|uniref:hypothetical protein n=1 Tax=Lysinibacillus sphaericus TaxID=1421 RepID=UPI003F7A78C6